MSLVPEWRPWRRWKRNRLLAQSPAPEWQQGVATVRHIQRLDPLRRGRVERDARIFAAETHWEGCNGLVVTERMKAVISALACLLVVDTQQTLYEDVSSVLLYPSRYVAPAARGTDGVMSEGSLRLGEAHFRGPVVLSWSDSWAHATQPLGRNVVLHEFAHRLDMLDGLVDGTPPLPPTIPLERWIGTMTDEYESLRGLLASGGAVPLDPYAATNPGEFFAVSTEAYFERPFALQTLRPELYGLLHDYYRVEGVQA